MLKYLSIAIHEILFAPQPGKIILTLWLSAMMRIICLCDLLSLLSVEEHVIVRGDHQTHVTQEVIAAAVDKLQNIL